MAKNSKTCPHCDVTSRKRQTENEQLFFSMSTRRLAESIEGLNSSLALAAGDLWPKKCRSIYWPARSLEGSNNGASSLANGGLSWNGSFW